MPDAGAKRVVVIGAGPVGLCVALRLAQQEIPVTLVEALSAFALVVSAPKPINFAG